MENVVLAISFGFVGLIIAQAAAMANIAKRLDEIKKVLEKKG